MISIDNQTILGTFDNNPELEEYIENLKKHGRIGLINIHYEISLFPRFEIEYYPYNKGE